MKTKVINIFLIFFLIVYPSLIFVQSPYHRNYSNHSFSINDYLVSDYEQKLNSDFIRMDSLISTSVQGTSSKFQFQYNENNKMTVWLNLFNTGSGWENSLKNSFLYDNQNNLTTEINFGWYSNDWDSLSRINYGYKNGLLSQSVFQNYNNNYWENSSRRNYEYDENQNLSITLTEDWINNNWQNWLLITNYYSLQNKRDSTLFQTWVNNDWQNDKKTIFYYSDNQIDLDSIVVKVWNGLSWINLFKREVVNDVNHNQIEQIDKEWSAGSWSNSIRRFYTYNENNYIEYAYCEILYNNQWMGGDGDIVFKNPDGFTIGFITNNVSACYSNVVSVDENENLGISDYSLSQNFPNPFNPSTYINYTVSEPSFISIKIYDVLGNEIEELVSEVKETGNHSVKFNAPNLASGVYFYTLKANGNSFTKKMLLVK